MSLSALLPLSSTSVQALVLDSALAGLSKNTCRVYTAHLAEFLDFVKRSNIPLSRLSVQQFLGAREMSQAVYNQALSAIKRLSVEAANHGWIEYQTAQQIDSLPSRIQRGTKVGNWLTKDETRALLAAADRGTKTGQRDFAVLALLIGTGIRREELAQLDWSQLQKRDGRWHLINVLGKGSRVRTIALPEWVYQGLFYWRGNVEDGKIVRSIKQNGTIHGSLSASGIWNIVLHYAALIGVTCKPHDLRRTYAKLARKGNAPLEVIQKSLGHASIKTTEHYVNSGEEANAGDYLNL